MFKKYVIPNLKASIFTQELSATEEQFYPGRVNWQYLLSMDREDVDTEQQRAHHFFYKPVFSHMFGMTTLRPQLH